MAETKTINRLVMQLFVLLSIGLYTAVEFTEKQLGEKPENWMELLK